MSRFWGVFGRRAKLKVGQRAYAIGNLAQTQIPFRLHRSALFPDGNSHIGTKAA